MVAKSVAFTLLIVFYIRSFLIRTSNFGPETEPKLDIYFLFISLFFLHVFSLKRSWDVLKLRGIECPETDTNVTRKPKKDHCALYHIE